MRVRKKRHGEERFAACSDICVSNGINVFKSMTSDVVRPMILEIGCGKGAFIVEYALRHPECDFIAMELVSDVLTIAMEKAKTQDGGCPDNLRFINASAEKLTELFEEKSVDIICLNFSDPWPKSRHAKRRLTCRTFLNLYSVVLKHDGMIVMKTDNDGLFDFTLEELAECGWIVENVTRDLHSSVYADGNIMTEYERNFSSKGKNINYLTAYPRR